MKKYLFTAIAATLATAAFAQETAQEVIIEQTATTSAGVASSGKSNWFISAGAGAQVFFGDHDRQRSFGQRISPALDIAVGKWVTPVVGMRLMYSGLSAKGATQDEGTSHGPFSNGKPLSNKPWSGYWLTESKFDFMNLHFDVMFDLCNWIGGYNPGRVYSVIPYGGVGYARTWNRPHENAISGQIGILNSFHVSKAFDINLDVRATAFNDNFDGQEGSAHFDGLVTANLGITYRFAPRGFSALKEVVTVREYDNDAVNALRAQVADLIAKNEKLEREKGKAVTHKVVEYVGGKYIIYFPINVSSLNNADRAQLEMCSNAIKAASPETKFLIMGYADKATGTPEINEILSRTRAENVRACLVNEFGINANRFEVKWKGGVDNMFFDDPSLSRVVIVSPISK